MGLFGKKDKDANSLIWELSTVDPADNQDNLDDSASESESEQSSVNNSNPMNYGIQDAIALMRQLSGVDSDIVISVVRKTLESTKIHVSEIIADAEQREAAIQNRSKGLISKIGDLEKQITELNAEINNLNTEIEETTQVKNLLVGSIQKEKQQPAKTAYTKQPSSKPAGGTSEVNSKPTTAETAQNKVKDASIA